MQKPTVSEAIGFIFGLIGIGGLAGWTETGTGFWLSILVLCIGIFNLYKAGVWHK